MSGGAPPVPESFTEALARRVLLCDGAMGTLAQASGVRAEGPGAELTLVAPELVSALHRRYLVAGADVLETHTYGASRLRLAPHGLGRRVRELNLAGARIAAAARDGAGRPVWVAGSVSPATPARRGAAADPSEVAAAVREQAEALVEGGVDLVLLETFSHGDELVAAVDAVREVTDLPVVAQATFVDEDGTPVTASGEAPADVLALLADRGLAAVGTNCTLGPQGLLGVVRRMAARTDLPLAAQPNAGLPHVVSDRSVHFAADAEHFGRYVARYAAAGARLVGGCCGTTPEHTAAAAAAIAAMSAEPDAEPVAAAAGPAALTAGPALREALDGDRGVVVAGDPGAEPTPDVPVPDGEQAVGRGGVDRWLRPAGGTRTFLLAAEVGGPGPSSPEEHVRRARVAAARGVAMMWVSRPRARRALITPAGLAVHLHDHVEVDTALTVTSWDTSIMALQADLLGLHALGIRTVVCETGNPPVHADQPVRDGVWEVDAIGLLRLASGLNRGVDGDGQELPSATSFRLGTRFTPGTDDLDREARRTQSKIESGAEFLVSRPVYELDRLRALLDALDAGAGGAPRVPVLLSVAPLADFAQAEHLHHEVPDVVLPEAVLDRMRAAGGDPTEQARAGLEIAEELVRAAAGLVDGVVLRLGGASSTVVTRLRAAARAGSS